MLIYLRRESGLIPLRSRQRNLAGPLRSDTYLYNAVVRNTVTCTYCSSDKLFLSFTYQVLAECTTQYQIRHVVPRLGRILIQRVG